DVANLVSRIVVLLLGIAPGLPAQTAHSGAGPRARLEGKWQAKTEDEIRNIIVRSDSSAQFGDQVARWRVVDDSLWLTLGDGVWQVYRMKLDADKLTLSGGDLEKPVTLRRVGPPPARADSVAIPAPPPPTECAWDGSREPSGRLADVRDPPSVRRPGKTDRLAEARLPLGSATRRHVQVDGPHGGVRGVGARAQLVEGVSSGEPRVALKKPLPRRHILVGHTRH